MTNLSGVISTINSSAVKGDANLPDTGAIGIIGSYDEDTMIGASLSITSADVWSGTGIGRVFEFDGISDRFSDYLGYALSGVASGTDWTEWSEAVDLLDGVGTSVGSFHATNNLFMALSLIREFNSTVKIYACVIESSSGGATAGASLTATETNALAALLEYDDISFINVAGRELLTGAQSHITSARNNIYNSPRIYVTGYGIDAVMSGTTFMVDEITANKTTDGSTIAYVGSAKKIWVTDDDNGNKWNHVVHMGGNWLAHAVTAKLAGSLENDTLLRKSSNWLGSDARGYYASSDWSGEGTVTDSKSTFIWKNADMITLFENGFIFSRKKGNNYFFDKAVTHALNTNAFSRIMYRRIVDKVDRDISTLTDAYIREKNIGSTHSRINSTIQRYLNVLYINQYIEGSFISQVWATAQDKINRVCQVTVTFTPINEIEEISLTFNLSIGE